MNTTRSPFSRLAMALAIAYLLVLQALVGGIASGAHASGIGSGTLDPAICRGAQDTVPTAPGEPAHHTPECCFTGCQINAASAPPPVALTEIAVPAPLPAVRIAPTAPRHHPASLDRSPQHARAPPLA